ncbi:hypothetical protein ID866_10369 [Astraeus odoratus]|nr:hypothetical protein ID866_10369 [Astraeus odoratus]
MENILHQGMMMGLSRSGLLIQVNIWDIHLKGTLKESIQEEFSQWYSRQTASLLCHVVTKPFVNGMWKLIGKSASL